MPFCPSCATQIEALASVCGGCGRRFGPPPTALVATARTLPARERPQWLVPRMPALSGTRLALGAMIPALAGLLAREAFRYWLGRHREQRLFRVRGSIVRQVNGQAETIVFDTDILGRSGKR